MKIRHLLVIASFTLAACAPDPESGAPATYTPGHEMASDALNAHLATIKDVEVIADDVERCLAYPDLPGNAWASGSADARCRLIRIPGPSLSEIGKILDKAGGERSLEEQFGRILQEHYSDQDHRGLLFAAFPFDASDEAGHIAELWVKRAPESAFARVALAKYRLAAAWQARGERYVSETSPAHLGTMRRLVLQAIPLFEEALAIEPRLMPACLGMIDIGMLVGDVAIKNRGVAACDSADPASWQLMRMRMAAAQPKWGGSPQEIIGLVEVARQRVVINPALGEFLGAQRRLEAKALFDAERWSEAMPVLQSIVHAAPDPLYLGYAGRVARKLKNNRLALAYLSQALRLAPEDTYLLSARAALFDELDDYPRVIADAERAIALGSKSGHPHALLANAKQALGDRHTASREYEIAMRDPSQRRWAFERWCELKVVPQVVIDEALGCTAGFLSEYPEYPKALFMRAWVLSETGDPDAAAIAEQFYAVADTRKRSHASMVSQLRQRLSSR